MSSNKESSTAGSATALPPGVIGCNLEDRGDHSGDLLTLLIASLDDLLRPRASGKLK